MKQGLKGTSSRKQFMLEQAKQIEFQKLYKKSQGLRGLHQSISYGTGID